MQIATHKTDKLKLLLIAIFITLFSLLLLNHPLQVQATSVETGGNGIDEVVSENLIVEGGQSEIANNVFQHGKFQGNGWLVYLVDDDGNVVSDVVLATAIGTPNGFGTAFCYTRYGNLRPNKTTKATWTPAYPFDYTNQGMYGEEVKNWMNEPCEIQGRHMTNACKVVHDMLGNDAFKLFTEEWEDHYLVLDVVAWTPVVVAYRNGHARVNNICASAIGWSHYTILNDVGVSNLLKDDAIIEAVDTSWITHRACQLSAFLDLKWDGLADPPGDTSADKDGLGRVNRSAIQNKGYGEIAIEGRMPEGIHTYNGKDSPGPPERPDKYTPPHDGKSQMVKTYYTENEDTGEITEDGTFSQDKTTPTIHVDAEPVYQIVAWKSSKNTVNSGITSKNWYSATGAAIQSGDGPCTVELKESDGEKTVYVLLKRVIGEEEDDIKVDFVLNQSEITRRVRLSKSKIPENRIDKKVFQWISAAHISCPGHPKTTGYNDDGTAIQHLEKCDLNWKDNQVTFSLKPDINQDNSKKIIATTGLFKSELIKKGDPDPVTRRVISTTRTSKSGTKLPKGSKKKNWDYMLIIMRGEDKLTLAKWKNKGSDTPLTAEGFVSSNDLRAGGGRKTEDYTSSCTVTLSDDSPDPFTQVEPTKFADSDGEHCNLDTKTFMLSPLATKLINIGVKVKVFSGEGKGMANMPTKETGSIGIGAARKQGYTVGFTPYIQMQYDNRISPSAKGSRNIAYVLSENNKSLNVYDYATVDFKSASSANLDITSSQFSMHNQAALDTNNGEVLPGGASYNIEPTGQSEKTFTITTYQVVLEQGTPGYEQVEKTGTIPQGICTTVEEAKNRHLGLHNQVYGILSSTYMEQLVDKDVQSSLLDCGENKVVTKGSDIGFLENGSTNASEDKKYWLVRGAIGISGDTFNIKDTKPVLESQAECYAKSDGGDIVTTGNVYDEYTNVSSAVKAALERGTGNDSRSGWGTKWYNEAFDGIKVVKYKSTITLGLWDQRARTTLLDTKLIPRNKGKAELFKDYNTSQYRTHKKETLGTWGGSIKISPSAFQKLFYSDPFYIPNVTVQDLH